MMRKGLFYSQYFDILLKVTEADVAKLVDALDLGSSEQPSWEFESLRPHSED